MATDDLFRKVGVLSLGSLLGHIFLFVPLPLLTRLYSPAQFQLLTVYVSILSILIVVSNLRLNLAIGNPEDDTEAIALLILSVISSLVLALFVGLVVSIIDYAALLSDWILQPYSWLLPLGVAFAGLYQALLYWSSRRQRYVTVAKTKVSRAASSSATQVAFGIFGAGPIGLLLGQFCYVSVGALALLKVTIKDDLELIKKVRKRDLCAGFNKSRQFITTSVPEALANSCGIHIPVLMIAYSSGNSDAAYVGLAMQILSLPLALVGQSAHQVVMAEAPRTLGTVEFHPMTRRLLLGLFMSGSVMFLSIFFVTTMFTEEIFGDEWGKLAEVITWLLPWHCMQFITSPLSGLLHVTSRLRIALWLQISGLLLRISTIIAFDVYTDMSLTAAYGFGSAAFYMLYFGVVLHIIKNESKLRERRDGS
ncbi:oligosaccharide flippase family protein [Luminiphilus sp.]|nr:oligosaccharide flippase family protein [Luminiphilus sp.]